MRICLRVCLLACVRAYARACVCVHLGLLVCEPHLAGIGLILAPSLLGSGPVGDDNLWYHHIPGTLNSLSFFLVLPWVLPPGSEALPAGFRAFPAGSEALLAGSKALPAVSKADPA